MKTSSLLHCFIVAVLFHSTSASSASPQTSRVMDGPGRIRDIPWEQFDNQLVEVEGLAWGAFDKGLGAHLRLAQNDEVYLENIDLTNTDLNGRLLNLVGVFRKKRVEKAPPGAQGYGESFDYYSIDVVAARKIEKVEQYQVLPPRNEWILPGMPVAQILQKLQARNWDLKDGVAAAPDGSKLHNYQIEGRRFLGFKELNGQIINIWEFQYNQGQPLQSRTINLRGFELPPLTAAKSMDK
jgi:hypothetical protein